jgi:thioredoxin 2
MFFIQNGSVEKGGYVMDTPAVFTLKCRSCGTKNRIPAQKAALSAKCGKCGSPIPTADLFTGRPVVIHDHDFDARVISSPLPVLLDCWAPWCGPCKMVAPLMDELVLEWKGKVKVCKLNVDDNPSVSSRYQIRSIPTLMIFDNGEVKTTRVGALPKHQIIEAMRPFL